MEKEIERGRESVCVCEREREGESCARVESGVCPPAPRNRDCKARFSSPTEVDHVRRRVLD